MCGRFHTLQSLHIHGDQMCGIALVTPDTWPPTTSIVKNFVDGQGNLEEEPVSLFGKSSQILRENVTSTFGH